jgi:hypothetical protein
MKSLALGALAGLLLFVAWILFLHVEEADAYPLGSAAAPADPMNGGVPAWLPPSVTLTRSAQVAWLVDRNGWHHFWKSGSRRLYYTDPAHLSHELRNRTAGDPGGEWILEGRAGAADLRLHYDLRIGTYPGDAAVERAGLAVPRRLRWFTRRVTSDRTESHCDFWWELR